MTFANFGLLLCQALIYFTIMALLFRARRRFGLGLFVCALGVMHFLETYLASVFYIELPFGIISPGSTVLFSGKLLIILMLYIKEDAQVVRQPIYGLFFGNLMIVGLVLILRNHQVLSVVPGKEADLSFVSEMGWLMVWGTTLLFIDSIALILVYEKLGRVLREWPIFRIFIASSLILTFDQIGFFIALHYVSGAPFVVMFGGWVAKMGAALVYSVMVGLYLRYAETGTEQIAVAPRLKDVFDVLTYRERYETLLHQVKLDPLTGALDRGQFDADGEQMVEGARLTGRPASLLLIDIYHFKRVNDGFGHAEGDIVLRELADMLTKRLREEDKLFRYGGEEFVVLADGLPHRSALGLAERLRRVIAEESGKLKSGRITVSIGVATAPEDGGALVDLFVASDKRLYQAKDNGRDQVIGQPEPAGAAGAE